MSEYAEIDIDLVDSQCIKQALEELGYVVEEHKEPQSLRGWLRSKSKKANIIVRKSKDNGLFADAGLLRNEKGKYDLIYDNYDKAKSVVKDLKKIYTKHKVLKQGRNSGWRKVSEKTDDKGRVVIKLSC